MSPTLVLADAVNLYAFIGAAGSVCAALALIIRGGFVVSKQIITQIEATKDNTDAIKELTKVGAGNTNAIDKLSTRVAAVERGTGRVERAVESNGQ